MSDEHDFEHAEHEAMQVCVRPGLVVVTCGDRQYEMGADGARKLARDLLLAADMTHVSQAAIEDVIKKHPHLAG